jgi:hypothetical protein
MAPHEQRVVDEKKELDAKIVKLESFIFENPVFSTLWMHEQVNLTKQYKIMMEYSQILGDGIKGF